MKYLAELEWSPHEAQKVTELYMRWNKPKDLHFLLDPHTLLGNNKAIIIFECSDEALGKVDRYWRQVCNVHVSPLMRTDDLIKIKP